MGGSSDQLQRQIADVRGEMESRIVELRDRSRRQVRRASRAMLVAAVAAAAIGAGAIGVFVAYRMTRPATFSERMARLVPPGIFQRLRHLRESLELGLRRQVPPLRLYVGDRQVGEERPAARWERIVIRAAQAAGTAAASAVVSRLIASRRRP